MNGVNASRGMAGTSRTSPATFAAPQPQQPLGWNQNYRQQPIDQPTNERQQPAPMGMGPAEVGPGVGVSATTQQVTSDRRNGISSIGRINQNGSAPPGTATGPVVGMGGTVANNTTAQSYQGPTAEQLQAEMQRRQVGAQIGQDPRNAAMAGYMMGT